MANEAVLVYETYDPIPMTVANGTGIEKGALLTLSDPNTAALLTDSTSAHAGIAAAEKIASDGVTTLDVYRGGVFKVTASGSVTIGKRVCFETGNKVMELGATGEHSGGVALEEAADGETFLMELKPTHNILS